MGNANKDCATAARTANDSACSWIGMMVVPSGSAASTAWRTKPGSGANVSVAGSARKVFAGSQCSHLRMVKSLRGHTSHWYCAR